MKIILSLSLPLVFFFGPLLHGAETGTITGRVVDGSTGLYLAGATVRVGETSAKTVTGSDGRYLIANVPEGKVTLVVDYLGLDGMKRTVEIQSGQTLQQDFEMGIDVVSLDTMVVEGALVGQARAINLQRTSPNLRNVIVSVLLGHLCDLGHFG